MDICKSTTKSRLSMDFSISTLEATKSQKKKVSRCTKGSFFATHCFYCFFLPNLARILLLFSPPRKMVTVFFDVHHPYQTSPCEEVVRC